MSSVPALQPSGGLTPPRRGRIFLGLAVATGLSVVLFGHPPGTSLLVVAAGGSHHSDRGGRGDHRAVVSGAAHARRLIASSSSGKIWVLAMPPSNASAPGPPAAMGTGELVGRLRVQRSQSS
jgi:hypothetical protein